jgi:endo-1,4-beta-xylanase
MKTGKTRQSGFFNGASAGIVRSLSLAFVIMVSEVPSQKYFGNIWQWRTAADAPASFTELYDQVTIRKWGKWDRAEKIRGVYDWDTLDAMYDWAEKTGSLVKQHAFIWHSSEPVWFDTSKAPYNNPDSVKAIVYKWISDYVKRYKTKIDMIDVLNEPLEGNNQLTIKQLLGGSGATGWDWVVWPYQTARDLCRIHAPNAKLILNEFNVLKGDSRTTKFLELVKVLQDRKLIDGIGEQGHFYEGAILNPSDANYIDTAVMRRNLNRLAATGLPIHISEFDMSLKDDQEQLLAYKTVFPMFWEHPAVAGITLWGYLAPDMWRFNAYLIRSDGTERPALTWLRGYLTKTTVTGKRITTGSPAVSRALPSRLVVCTGNGGYLTPVVKHASGNSIDFYKINGSRINKERNKFK